MLCKMLGSGVRFVIGGAAFWLRNRKVAPVHDSVAQGAQAAAQPGVADGARPHVHATSPLAQVHRDTDDANREWI